MNRGLLLCGINLLLWMKCIQTSANVVKRSESGQVVNANEEVNKEDIEAVKKYMLGFTNLETQQPSYQESSSNGHGVVTRKDDITTTPAFMDTVATLQKANGEEITGKITSGAVAQSKKSRCGMPDISDDDQRGPAGYTAASTAWSNKYSPNTKLYELRYGFDESTFPTKSIITNREVKEGIIAAFCMWEKYSNIRFVTETKPVHADIKISFGQGSHGDGFSFDGPGGTLAHAFYPTNGRLHFDADEPWYLSKNGNENDRRKDIFTVAAHEIGHNLGLKHSEESPSLMAPYYDFQGSYTGYILPEDDSVGIDSMYGTRKESDPLNERQSACHTLKQEYGTEVQEKQTGSDTNTVDKNPTVIIRSTTLRPTRKPTTTTKRPSTDTNVCKDDENLGKYCKGWKDRGYCEESTQAASMRRRCRETCNLCGDQKTEKPEVKKPEAPKTVCDVGSMSTVITLYDHSGYYDSWHFKDDYYVRTYSHSNKRMNKDVNHLTTDFNLGPSFQFYTDPKTYIAGSMKYAKRDMFFSTTKLRNLLPGSTFYLAFEDDQSGRVNQYTKGTPTTSLVGYDSIENMFPGFPSKRLSGSYVEYVDNEKIYTLFDSDKYWQYKKSSSGNLFDKDASKIVRFEPIPDKSGLSIKTWKGVYACNIDAVFSYEGKPYFLKDNLFWPASTKDKEFEGARDISYYFYRCKNASGKTFPIPASCNYVKRARSGSTTLATNYSLISLLIVFSFILQSLF